MTYSNSNLIATDPNNGIISATTIQLTSAQVKALIATPIQVLAAPAAGKMIIVHTVASKLNYGGTNAFTNPQAMGLRYNGFVTNLATGPSTNFINATANCWGYWSVVGITTTAATSLEAKAIMITNSGGSEITGNAANDNTVTIALYYSVITL